jgi:uncharacterized protein YxjI
MDVTVQERKVSFGSEYDISAPGESYYAKKPFFSLLDNLELQQQDGSVVAQILGKFSILREKHDFNVSDGRVYQFGCEDMWKRIFTCVGNGESYRLFEHSGRKYSVFKDDRQIAAFVKNLIVIGSGNEYELRMDADADLIVILCMMLSINSSEEDNDNATVTIDLGRIGPEGRPFDEGWEPR